MEKGKAVWGRENGRRHSRNPRPQLCKVPRSPGETEATRSALSTTRTFRWPTLPSTSGPSGATLSWDKLVMPSFGRIPPCVAVSWTLSGRRLWKRGSVSPSPNVGGSGIGCSPWDRVWGNGLGLRSKGAIDPAQWPGQNLLGRILTQLRVDLAAEEMDRVGLNYFSIVLW